MDRTYLAVDTVKVFETVKKPADEQTPVATFKDRPYPANGYDNYRYQGRLYRGYTNHAAGNCIFLDAPLHPSKAKA